MPLRPRADDHMRSHPRPADVLLVAEVATATLGFDRGVKAQRDAGSGVAEYGMVDLADRRVEVHRRPGHGGYGERTAHARGVLAPARLPAAAVDVEALFG